MSVPQVPSIDVPKMNAPSLPDVSTELPSGQLPNIPEVPELPSLSSPEMPKVSAPEFPSVSVPGLAMVPEVGISAAKISAPQAEGFSVPKVEGQDFELPKLGESGDLEDLGIPDGDAFVLP